MPELIPDFYADKYTVTVRDDVKATKHFDSQEEARQYEEAIIRATNRLGRTTLTSPEEKASRLAWFNGQLNEEPTVTLRLGRSLGSFVINAVLKEVERARAEGYPQDAQQYHNHILRMLREQAEECFPVYDTSD